MAPVLLVQRQPHHRGEIFARIGGLVSRKLKFEGTLSGAVGNLVNIDGRECQQAYQQEVTDYNQNGTIHVGVAKEARVAPTGSSTGVSASSRSLRRAGRRWKILKKDTKMIPNEVEE